MSDREKLLMALLEASERRVGAQMTVLDVVSMLDWLGADRRLAEQRKTVLTSA
jgi:hypothetical protein